MEKFFNTAGPNKVNKHYCVPMLERFNLTELENLIDAEKYFILHAPRQTGKTSCMLSLMAHLNNEGKYKALYVNVEAAQVARHNVDDGVDAILSIIGDCETNEFKTNIVSEYRNTNNINYNNGLLQALSLWSQNSDKPTVLIIDEIDSLIGDTLISVLRQLRAGYTKRPADFPQSIILCGVRDIKDYRIQPSSGNEALTGGSCFNVKATSLRLGDFTHNEVVYLLNEHTKETGQIFEDEAKELIWTLTNGQPWLVNDLAYRVTYENKIARDRSVVITKEMVETAKKEMILDRVTHLDHLADKLKEERVRNIIEPMILGKAATKFDVADVEYCYDLGLIRNTSNGYVVSNPIYKEVIPRELSYRLQFNMASAVDRLWYINENEQINSEKLFKGFQEFYRENAQIWRKMADYEEAAPQLILQAFLQRIINGGGLIDREYAFNSYRTDLYIKWPYLDDGEKRIQKIVMELKVVHKNKGKGHEKTLEDGLVQLSKYIDICGSNEGHLFIFDTDSEKTWDDKVKYEVREYKGKIIHIWMQ